MLLLLCVNQKYFEILFSLVSLFLTLYFGFTWEPQEQQAREQKQSATDQSTRTSKSAFHLNSTFTFTSSSLTCSCHEHYLQHYQHLQYLNQSHFCPLDWSPIEIQSNFHVAPFFLLLLAFFHAHADNKQFNFWFFSRFDLKSDPIMQKREHQYSFPFFRALTEWSLKPFKQQYSCFWSVSGMQLYLEHAQTNARTWLEIYASVTSWSASSLSLLLPPPQHCHHYFYYLAINNNNGTVYSVGQSI